MIKGFGINADAAWLENDLNALEGQLALAVEQGFDYVEIPLHGVGAMIGGRLVEGRVKEIERMLKGYQLKYTVHAPNPLNLMDLENHKWQAQTFYECLVFTAQIEAEVLVYHSGRFLPEELFHTSGVRHVPDEALKKKMLIVERETLEKLAIAAEKYGIMIGMENARPYLDGSPYCYAESLEGLAEQVKLIAHPNLGITFDVGHAYLASCYYGFNLFEHICLAAPYIRHIHLHDNYGKPSTSLEKKQAEMMAMGRGDLHLPVGWGEVPVREIFDLLCNYTGVVTHEIRPRYHKWAPEALAWGRQLVPSQCR